MSTQPKALRLADANAAHHGYETQIAAELRRLHQVNTELVEALRYVVTRIHDSEEWWMDVEHKGGFDVEKLEAAITKATGE